MNKVLHVRMENDPSLRAATEWFFELRSDGVTGERIAEWQEWLSQDTSHRDAFARVESFWHSSDQLAARWPSDAEVARDAYSGTESITAWRARSARHGVKDARRRFGLWMSRPAWRLSLAGTAVAALIAILGLIDWPTFAVMLQGGSRITVETAIGRTRTVTLPDNSIVFAGADTALTVTLLRHSRSVVLGRGEAFFHIAKDRARPFTVRAGNTTVTALGTAFDVRRTPAGVVVAVAEGTVQVAASTRAEEAGPAHPGRRVGKTGATAISQLKAGQHLSIGTSGAMSRIASVDSSSVAGWREGRLQYFDEPLELAVADLSRYSTRRIVIDDPSVADLRVTGIVFERNIDAWLVGLETTFPVRVVNRADGTVSIESRRQ